VSNVVVVDIGNTSTSVALARNGRITRHSHHGSHRACPGGAEIVASHDTRSRGRQYLPPAGVVRNVIRQTIRGVKIDGAVLCSVVPKCNAVWLTQLRKATGTKPLLVSHKLDVGVRISYLKPGTIGADRLANACGAVGRYGKGPVIVADFGTALTFDIVTAANAYIGGVIAPGLPLMTDYLFEKTALLPRVDLPGRYGKVGRSTVEAMRIGAKIGYRGIVREVTQYLQKGLNMKNARLLATGGFAEWALEGLDLPFKIDKDLTLYGLSRIFDLNRHIKHGR
jgi:type III pantothenate kinase